jgi:hypothetical protein
MRYILVDMIRTALACLMFWSGASSAALVTLGTPTKDGNDWTVAAAFDAETDFLGITLQLAVNQLSPAAPTLSFTLLKSVTPDFAPDTGASPFEVVLPNIVENAAGTLVTWRFQGLPVDQDYGFSLLLTGQVAPGTLDEILNGIEQDAVQVSSQRDLVNTVSDPVPDPVPEPTAWILLLAGLAVLAAIRSGRMARTAT